MATMSLMLSIEVLGVKRISTDLGGVMERVDGIMEDGRMAGWQDEHGCLHCGEEEQARGSHLRIFPILAFHSVDPSFSLCVYMCTVICTYFLTPHFSLSHSPPLSGLLFYQLNLALTGAEGFLDPNTALKLVNFSSSVSKWAKIYF